ncbi:hypothetical protein [Bacillus coahuilensis]|uniref:hypothetical protein n=1 Tax=Bacillus coahuilensis TaxID=408580 RepID=UPI00018508A7
MLGLLIKEVEMKELEYLLKREMDEILLDLTDSRIDSTVKRAMKERYTILFSLFKRVAPKNEIMSYMLQTPYNQNKRRKSRKIVLTLILKADILVNVADAATN